MCNQSTSFQEVIVERDTLRLDERVRRREPWKLAGTKACFMRAVVIGAIIFLWLAILWLASANLERLKQKTGSLNL